MNPLALPLPDLFVMALPGAVAIVAVAVAIVKLLEN